ncbi:hypothetical protein CDIK_2662 [Cucumispora dikerogammari]|nr:hypothetical protein CDIK_2662 [Cucumispora dikerogammari]
MKEKILSQLISTPQEIQTSLEELTESPSLNVLITLMTQINSHKNMLKESSFLFHNNSVFNRLLSLTNGFIGELNEIRRSLHKQTHYNSDNINNNKILCSESADTLVNSSIGGTEANKRLSHLITSASSNLTDLISQGQYMKQGNESHHLIDKQMHLTLKRLKDIYARIKTDKRIVVGGILGFGVCILIIKYYFF